MLLFDRLKESLKFEKCKGCTRLFWILFKGLATTAIRSGGIHDWIQDRAAVVQIKSRRKLLQFIAFLKGFPPNNLKQKVFSAKAFSKVQQFVNLSGCFFGTTTWQTQVTCSTACSGDHFGDHLGERRSWLISERSPAIRRIELQRSVFSSISSKSTGLSSAAALEPFAFELKRFVPASPDLCRSEPFCFWLVFHWHISGFHTRLQKLSADFQSPKFFKKIKKPVVESLKKLKNSNISRSSFRKISCALRP